MTHRETSPATAADRDLLQQAIDLGLQCPPSRTAFSVGAVIVAANGDVVATGYSRESEPDAHAEETALAKVDAQPLAKATLYSSLEPCSVRSSRSTSCTDLILAAGIERVVFALHEPAIFVEGRGGERLAAAGVQVVHLPELAAQVEQVNAHLLHT
ncbi:MAG: dCMP deaminase [Streptosporangiales bacterium]|nr:dCMP deaminase [Streptosporangiales bacterium]